MVGTLFQAITDKKMICFLYRGMTRYVTPTYVEATAKGSVLHGFEKASPVERAYNVIEMVALKPVESPDAPETRRFTPYVFELEEKLSLEQQLLKASSKSST